LRIHNTDFMVDLVDVLHELKSQLSQNNIDLLDDIKDGPKNVQVTCIYHADGHEHKPSAGIKKDTGVYHCFACGETHDFPEFISNCFGKNDLGSFGWSWLLKNFLTVQTEDRHVNIDISRSIDNRSDSGEQFGRSKYVSEEELDTYRYTHPYWKERGITDKEIIEAFDLGYDNKTKSITFPVRDINGNCLFVARRSVKTKFFNYPQGVQKPLYGLYELSHANIVSGSRSGLSIIVCESMIDCILLWQEGHPSLALNGLGNELQFKQLRELPVRRLILATDNDDAGMKARERIRKNVKNKLITEIQFPDGVKDIGECNRAEIKHILDWERL